MKHVHREHNSGVVSSIIGGGGGAYSYIHVGRDRKNNRFQKKLIEHEYSQAKVFPIKYKLHVSLVGS